MEEVEQDFSDVVTKISVGQTYLGVDIPGYLLTKSADSINLIESAKLKPTILINGAHHARELTSIA